MTDFTTRLLTLMLAAGAVLVTLAMTWDGLGGSQRIVLAVVGAGIGLAADHALHGGGRRDY